MTTPTVTEEKTTPQGILPFNPDFKIKEQLKYEGQLFNNFRGEIDLEVAEKIQQDQERYGTHNTKNPWWGHVCWRDGRWIEQISEKGSVIDQFDSDNLEDLMTMVNAKYGED